MSSRIPHRLEPYLLWRQQRPSSYLTPPDPSAVESPHPRQRQGRGDDGSRHIPVSYSRCALTLLTGTLGAGTNWLVLRYLCGLLQPPQLQPQPQPQPQQQRRQTDTRKPDESERRNGGTGGSDGGVAVLLVSFMRDYAFWRDTCGRLGIDLEILGRTGRFGFVDGLSGLFIPDTDSAQSPSSSFSSTPAASIPWRRILPSPRLGDVARELRAAVDGLSGPGPGPAGSSSGGGSSSRDIVLIIDQPDVLLATTVGAGDTTTPPSPVSVFGTRGKEVGDGSSGSSSTSAALLDMLLDLREHVRSTIVTLAADEPLIAAQTTALEMEHAALALALAHSARVVMSLRLLDTGAAGDVSGVLRITGGGDVGDYDKGDEEANAETGSREGFTTGAEEEEPLSAVEEHEYLYHVGGDGGVKVFERGQSS